MNGYKAFVTQLERDKKHEESKSNCNGYVNIFPVLGLALKFDTAGRAAANQAENQAIILEKDKYSFGSDIVPVVEWMAYKKMPKNYPAELYGLRNTKAHLKGGNGQLTIDGAVVGTASELYRGGTLANKTPYGLSSGPQILQDNSTSFLKRRLKSVLGYFVNKNKKKRVDEYAHAHSEYVKDGKKDAIAMFSNQTEQELVLANFGKNANAKVLANTGYFVNSDTIVDDRIQEKDKIQQLERQLRVEIGRSSLGLILMILFMTVLGPSSAFLYKMFKSSSIPLFIALGMGARANVTNSWPVVGTISRIHRLMKDIKRQKLLLKIEDEKILGGRERGKKTAKLLKSDVLRIERLRQLKTVNHIVSSAVQSIENTARKGPIYLGDIKEKGLKTDDMIARRRGDFPKVANPNNSSDHGKADIKNSDLSVALTASKTRRRKRKLINVSS